MSDIYADGQLASGANDGTSWADAYQGAAGLQTAIDNAVAGDTVHVTRTFTLAAAIDVDQASGAVGNRIEVVGYNYNAGSPVNDGTKAVFDGNSAAASCIDCADKDYWTWRNIRFTGATGDNVTASVAPASYHSFINCDMDSAGADGVGNSGGSGYQFTHFILCRIHSNGTYGVSACSSCLYMWTSVYDNGSVGIVAGSANLFIMSAFWGNGNDNLFFASYCYVIACVSDDAADDNIYASGSANVVALSRITGTGDGIVGDGGAEYFDLFNFYNTGSVATNITAYPNVRGSSSRLTTGAEGYEDSANDLYNLILGAAGYLTEIDLGGGNYIRAPRGLPTMILPRIGIDP